jgi:hypothetical protein
VAEVRVQGNYRTPEAEVLQIAGVHVGDPDGGHRQRDRRAAAEERPLRNVDVRQRWRTLGPGDAAILILLREKAGGSGIGGRLAYAATHPMALPIVFYTDGYGLTYGGQVSPPNLLGKSTHVSIPLTWGGTKQAAIDINRQFKTGPITRLAVNGGIRERENPHYELDDNRVGGSVRVERRFARVMRVGANGSINDVRFGDTGRRRNSTEPVHPGARQTLVLGRRHLRSTRVSPDTATTSSRRPAGINLRWLAAASAGTTWTRLDISVCRAAPCCPGAAIAVTPPIRCPPTNGFCSAAPDRSGAFGRGSRRATPS